MKNLKGSFSVLTLTLAILNPMGICRAAENADLYFQVGAIYGGLQGDNVRDELRSGYGVQGSIRFLNTKGIGESKALGGMGYGFGVTASKHKHDELSLGFVIAEAHYIVSARDEGVSTVYLGYGTGNESIGNSDVDGNVWEVGFLATSNKKKDETYGWFVDLRYLVGEGETDLFMIGGGVSF